MYAQNRSWDWSMNIYVIFYIPLTLIFVKNTIHIVYSSLIFRLLVEILLFQSPMEFLCNFQLYRLKVSAVYEMHFRGWLFRKLCYCVGFCVCLIRSLINWPLLYVSLCEHCSVYSWYSTHMYFKSVIVSMSQNSCLFFTACVAREVLNTFTMYVYYTHTHTHVSLKA